MVLAKSKISREKLNIQKANSTPTRAFFVRNVRTPKENRLAVVHSMMACSGQSLRLADLPCVPVSHPTTRYRQTVRSSAIAFNQLTQGLSAMLYKFLLPGKHRLNPITINFIHHNTKMNENNSQPNLFTKSGDFFSIFTATANSVAEPENSNDKTLAYSNTPLNACFFMRSTNTPRRKTEIRLFNQSMVACYGKGIALCCVPMFAVSQPVTRYRPSLRTFAVTSKIINIGVTAMLYLFKAVSRSDLRNTKKHFSLFPRYTVRINADSIEQATAQVAPFFVILEVKNA
ncbi:ash family protein [Avibacterium paragallinarum]|uniref:ash family protein n=1 Tax=Avibacterium paragallinarum TaxID=728 RepID=UPI001CFAFD6A|nr:ash family protein [Avibacterium paragallinarum]